MNDDEGKQKDEAKQKKDLIIPRNALFGIAPAVAITAPAVAITAVLLSKDKPAEVLLLFIGIAIGVIITRSYLKK
ncbi:MAG: hypothetical protein ACYSUZ_02480 [Planctomycetota bacterium]|jgi:hypothetical protein